MSIWLFVADTRPININEKKTIFPAHVQTHASLNQSIDICHVSMIGYVCASKLIQAIFNQSFLLPLGYSDSSSLFTINQGDFIDRISGQVNSNTCKLRSTAFTKCKCANGHDLLHLYPCNMKTMCS